MNRYCKLIIGCFLFASIASCKKDFLDVPDKTTLLRQAYVTDLSTLNDFMNGVYVEMSTRFIEAGCIIYPELIADNIKPKTGTSYFVAQYKWTQQANNDNTTILSTSGLNANGFWYAGYRIIGDCNFVLENIDKYKEQGPAKAENLRGQAYALRALSHFLLVNVFSQSYDFTADGTQPGIPYLTSSDWSKDVARLRVADVYGAIISDLNNAISLLPAVQLASSGAVTTAIFNKNAAMALLARVYLFKNDFLAAKNLAREVGMKVPIMTGAGYPAKLFTSQETEALFQVPPSYSGAASGGGSYTAYPPGVYFAAPLLQYSATGDIAAILKENPSDVRNQWVTASGTGWLITKYPLNSVTGFPVPTFHYITILRSTEMYLTAAESYAQLNNEDSARYYLDAIRIRANPAAAISTATGSALLDSIYKERRKELSFEGFRMFDLLRWKKGVDRTDADFPTAQHLPYGDNRAISPIPTQDVQLSGLQQNSGY